MFDNFQTGVSHWCEDCCEPGARDVLSVALVQLVEDSGPDSFLSTLHFLHTTADPSLATDKHSANKRPKWVTSQINVHNSAPKSEQWMFLFLCSHVLA